MGVILWCHLENHSLAFKGPPTAELNSERSSQTSLPYLDEILYKIVGILGDYWGLSSISCNFETTRNSEMFTPVRILIFYLKPWVPPLILRILSVGIL